MIAKYQKVDMGNDSLFKSMFRDERSRKMVASVLSHITKIDEERILSANFIGGEIPKKQKDEKGKCSDLLIELDNDTIIIVEMNKFYYKTLFQKNTSYAFATYNRRTHVRDRIYPNVYLVNINNFKHFKKGKILRHMMIQDSQNNVDIHNYHVYHFDIETSSKLDYNDGDEVLIRFAKFMRAKNLDELKEIAKGDDAFMFSFDSINDFIGDDPRIVTYDREKLHEWEKQQIWEYGVEQGIEEGSSEKTSEIVYNMFKKKFDLETISEIASISINDVKKILNI